MKTEEREQRWHEDVQRLTDGKPGKAVIVAGPATKKTGTKFDLPEEDEHV